MRIFLITGGDATLGRDDIDHALADWALAQAGVAATSAHDKRAAMVAARAAKEALSRAGSAAWRAELAGGAVQVKVTRQQLETLARPLLDRTLAAVRKALRDAKLMREEVQGVVMVGGSTRMPLVSQAVSELCGHEVLTNVNQSAGVPRGRKKDV